MNATCLGCGLACDDIAVELRGRSLAADTAGCAVGAAWFAAATEPVAAPAADAVARAAGLLREARSPLVYLAADLPVEAYKEAIAIADLLRARLDGLGADTALAGILAAQVRGRPGATLGELLNRADLVLFWGVDPGQRYPRFGSRYALEPRGLATPEGRRSRSVIAVDIGPARGPGDADLRVAIAPDQELAALALMRAAVEGRQVSGVPEGLAPFLALRERLEGARYLTVVHDAEPSELRSNPLRAEALITLVQALNAPTRAVLTSLRAGGNRSGAEAVSTWQTGFPLGVNFAPGWPDYAPEPVAERLQAGRHDVVLVVGRCTSLPPEVVRGLAGVRVIALGPGAAPPKLEPAVTIPTGTAGIHEGGTAYRLDDVPLALPALLPGAPQARVLLGALRDAIAPARSR